LRESFARSCLPTSFLRSVRPTRPALLPAGTCCSANARYASRLSRCRSRAAGNRF
jgi:hypothetical protein